ncbi:hypothetical protein LIER_04187 [Lithospermum erythrorhizon]|uniref:Uncharacterized protein n=1 Tax=Lithospermum erythrorhizon TaxID=34254 RepID=A0AAV3NWM6_LITER
MEENFSSIFVPHNSRKFKSMDSIPSWCVQSRGHRFGVGQAIGEVTQGHSREAPILEVIMASSSPSDEHSPSSAYACFFELTPGRTPSPEYPSVVTKHYMYHQRYVALCGCVPGKSVPQLREMEYGILEQLEADLEDDPEYSVMHAALDNFFRSIDLLNTLDQEARLQLLDRKAAIVD